MPQRPTYLLIKQLIRALWLGAILALALQAAASAQPVVIIGIKDMPPLSYADGSGKLDRVIAEAFRRIGVRAEFALLPSERSLAETSAGVIDGDSNRVEGMEERYPNLVRVPESDVTYDFTAFARHPASGAPGWEGLKGRDVGYLIGWKILDENILGANVTKVANARELFTLLESGRVEIAVYERRCGEYTMQELGLADIRALEPPLARREMYLYLNKKHQGMVPALAKALKNMKADGTYAALLSNPDGK